MVNFLEDKLTSVCNVKPFLEVRGEKFYSKKGIVLFDESISKFHHNNYQSSIQKCHSLGTYNGAETRHGALEIISQNKDITSRLYYA